MADFITAIKVIEKNEGGYTDNPKDAGNYYPQNIKTGKLIGTNKGITPTTYKQAFGHVPTVAEMKGLTQNAARAIYKALYWNKINGDKLNDQQVATMMLDSAVNEGVGTSINYAKKLLKLPTNAVMDADTLKKLNAHNDKNFFNEFKDLRAEHYKALGGVFYEGWMKRLNSFSYIGGGIGIGLIIAIGILAYVGYKKRKTIGKSVGSVVKAAA